MAKSKKGYTDIYPYILDNDSNNKALNDIPKWRPNNGANSWTLQKVTGNNELSIWHKFWNILDYDRETK